MKRPPAKSEVAFSQNCLAGHQESNVFLQPVNLNGDPKSSDHDLESVSPADTAQALNRQTYQRLEELIQELTKRLTPLERRIE